MDNDVNVITPNVSGEDVIDEQDYIQAITELKANTVSKEQYIKKLKAENKNLLDALVNGQQIDAPASTVDPDEIRKKLFNADGNLSNLEYVKAMLELRTELISRGERDPFLPVGEKVRDSAEMYAAAQRVADGLQYCVDFAEGDSGIFTAQLQRITKDSPIRRR